MTWELFWTVFIPIGVMIVLGASLSHPQSPGELEEEIDRDYEKSMKR